MTIKKQFYIEQWLKQGRPKPVYAEHIGKNIDGAETYQLYIDTLEGRLPVEDEDWITITVSPDRNI